MPDRLQRPSLNGFYDIEETRLRARLDGVRLALSHAGEKGRVLENEAAAFVRSILPPEYGVSTGFIAYCEDGEIRMSSQLDIIIYDAVRGSPLIRYETCSIFPLEIVYAYIEVKASLDISKLSDITIKNREIRTMRQRWYWHPSCGSPPETVLYDDKWLPIRSFVFSFESRIGEARALARTLRSELAKAPEAHLHGVFIAGQGFFSPHRISCGTVFEEHPQELFFTDSHPLTAFKVMLVKCLATFPRCSIEHSPAVDRYHYDFVELSEGV